MDKVDNRRIECMVCASCTVWGKWGNHGGKAAGRGCGRGRGWAEWVGEKISEFLEVCGKGAQFLSGKWFGRNFGRRDCGRLLRGSQLPGSMCSSPVRCHSGSKPRRVHVLVRFRELVGLLPVEVFSRDNMLGESRLFAGGGINL